MQTGDEPDNVNVADQEEKAGRQMHRVHRKSVSCVCFEINFSGKGLP